MADKARVIAIGGSAGSLSVLRRLVAELPAELPVDILVTLHLPASHPSELAPILNRGAALPVAFARAGQELSRGRVFVAPPDFHLLVRDGRLSLSRGPRENLARPAIDPMFRSAAVALGPGVVGVVLSGRLDDGTAGLNAIKRAGGLAVVQDPAEAEYPDMPQSALDFVDVDHVVPSHGLADLLVRLLEGAAPGRAAAASVADIAVESAVASGQQGSMGAEDRLGQPSALSCPDCGGVLWRIQDGNLDRYRCHTGHAYSAETLDTAQGTSLEKALWSAVRLHRERIALARRMIAGALHRGEHHVADVWQHRAEEYERAADTILSLLLSGGDLAGRS